MNFKIVKDHFHVFIVRSLSIVYLAYVYVLLTNSLTETRWH